MCIHHFDMNTKPIVEGTADARPMARGINGRHMSDDSKWRELCQRIMSEKDPEKLWALVEELNKTLEQREQELRTEEEPEDARNGGPGDAGP